MSEDSFWGFEDFVNYCKETYENSKSSKNSGGSQNDGYYCGDIPGGFQDVNPQFFLIIGEILGNVVAGNMPFNIQNVIGNWLQLVGQAIETFNAQQQYMQSGPGRYYDIKNLNINNPFCSFNQNSSGQTEYEDSSQYINRGDDTDVSGEESINLKNQDIKELRKEIHELEDEISKLRKEINDIKSRG